MGYVLDHDYNARKLRGCIFEVVEKGDYVQVLVTAS